MKNVLKGTLFAGKTYCVKFHVNIRNSSPYGIDGFQAYLGDETLDTIKAGNRTITYLTPQVQNLTGNVITDTMSWTAISGTFVAAGTEKYLVLGNFKSDANTNTSLITPSNSATIGADVYVDDVSCIDIDLPAFAGRDTTFFEGDSIFLGRPSDIEIDESCIWYKLPDMTNPIDTIAGFWVKPTVTSTYVVRQQLWCSGVKWDTVTIFVDQVGMKKLKMLDDKLKIYPVPATDALNLEFQDFAEQRIILVSLTDKLGQILLQQDLHFEQNKAILNIASFQPGVYVLQLQFPEGIISRKVVISGE